MHRGNYGSRLLVLAMWAIQGCPPQAEQAEAEPTEAMAVAELPEPVRRDLDEIRKAGSLRVLLYGRTGALPRDGNPALQDEALAAEFAEQLGVEFVPVWVDRYDRLIEALTEGRGDLIAAQMTVTASRAESVRFSTARLVVDEVVVGQAGAEDLPADPKGLAGRAVHVRPSSSYARSLDRLRDEGGIAVEPVDAPEDASSLDLLQDVADGRIPLTVVDDNIFASAQTFMPGLKALFPVAEDRQLAWAVRPDQPELERAMNRYVLERALTTHTRDVYSVDLDGIRERKVLRVLTRNNSVSYFLHRGRQLGFDFELAQMIAETLDVRLQMVVAPSRDELVPWLLEGRAEMIAASLTVTEARSSKVAFSEPYMFVEEVVLKKEGAEQPRTVRDLAGRTVHVRESSSFFEHLTALQKAGVDVNIETVDETLETEELVEKVAEGEIELTVADSHLAAVERTYGTGVELAFELPPVEDLSKSETNEDDSRPDGESEAKDGSERKRGSRAIAFATAPSSPKLKAFLDDFVRQKRRGLRYNIAYKRYFESRRRVATVKEGRSGKTGRLSPYDGVIRKYARRYGFDWRLIAAQSFVESRFDPNAESWVGAKGLMQVMPRTGRSMGFDDLDDVDAGVHAGVRYLSRLMTRFDPSIPLRQRVRFALAAYNAGLGHVYDAQRLAAKLGKDPHRWFGNVERSMLLLSKPEYARKARHGYVRGAEPVAYVSHIQSKYDAYVKVVP